MKSAKEIKREAKYLFRLCFVNGSLDVMRVHSVLKGLLQSKRRGSLPIAGQFQRLVSLEQRRHWAKVESATPLTPELQADIQAKLVESYGSAITTSFTSDLTLIGGLRIQVGSDVYDGSIKSGLTTLENSF